MSLFIPSTQFPTVQKMRGWLLDEGGVSRKHLWSAVLGVVVILIVAVTFLTLAWSEQRTDAARNRAVDALRLAHAAEMQLSGLETSYHSYLLGRDPRELDQFHRRRIELQRTLAALIPLVNERIESRGAVRRLSTQLNLWLDRASPSEAAVVPQSRDPATAATRSPSKPIIDDLRGSMAAFVSQCDAEVVQFDSHTRFHRWLQIGGTTLLSVVAISFLVVSSVGGWRIFRVHLRKAESALAQTHSIITTTQDGVVLIDDQGHIQSINPSGERMFAQSAKKAIGQPISLLIPQRLFLHDLASVGRGSLMAMGQRQGYYPFPIEISLSELKVEGRRQFCALIRDVSERKRGEETLKHIGIGVSAATGEQFVRQLLRQLSKALSFNHAFLVEILGDGDNAVATLTLAEKGEMRASAPIDLRNTAFAEVLAKGFRAFTSGARAHFPEDSLLAETEAEAFVAMPLVDHRGKTVGLMGVLDKQALTETGVIESTLTIFATRAAAEIERKRSEEALAAEKERLAVTLRSIGDGCITLDNEGKIIMVNPVAERLTGWTQDGAAGKPVSEVLHLLDERTRRRCQHTLQRIAQNGQAEDMGGPTILVPRVGEERLVESSSAPIRDRSGRKVGVVIVLRDVTERQRLEEERQKAEKLESLGVVAGGIAHDFNNILTAILGNITLALTTGLEQTVAERLSSARTATHRAQELAGQLLTFARGGAPVKEPTDVSRLLSDTVDCTLAGSHTVPDFHFSEGLWPVEADPGQLSQVIANLTTNADQAMPSGGTIHITAENLDLGDEPSVISLAAGRWVRFSLKDHGVGIQEQYLKKIFDPYFTTKPKGSGLGLATAYSVVKNHGGVIVVESEPGRGSTFSVYLPASDKPLKPVPTPDLPVPTGTGRVLVLDDEEAICMLVTCALEPLGYEVTEVQDGAIALAKYEEAMKEGRKFDLVISDLTMPGRMSGHEAIKRLRELDPEVRAIVSSGYANDPVMSRHEEYGFCGMIAKPYEIDALGRKVAEIMAQPLRPRVIYHEFEPRKTA
ncbi:MAG: two-component system, cell cycle sensor histidine kinase and response regulator CckA [Chthoniobacter sp.]|jgi:PAS domain S-box-containing protein|nr:two-component system, cell cycle sensor histidine kinase and response regulator CckA [Chthoniobacter sp.]